MITVSSAFDTANAKLAKTPIFALEIDGYSRVFTNQQTGVDGHVPWIVSIGQLSYDVSPLDGSSVLADLTVTVLDYQRLLTADFPSNVLEGKTCRLKHGFPGMSYSDYVTLWTGKVDAIPSQEYNNAYDLSCKDTLLDLKQVIYQTGDDGQPTDSDHPKTVLGNPIDIIVSVILDYCDLDPSLLDTTTLYAYRDTFFAGAYEEFTITSPPEAKAWIEDQLMKPLGGYLRSNNLGVITPVFMQPLPGSVAAAMTLDKSNLTAIPQADQADLVNVVSVRFDKVGDKYTSEAVFTDDASVTKYGIQGQHVIESDGLRSGFQGFFQGKLTANAIFVRFGDKNPQFSINSLWDEACLIEDGDFVEVTHELIPDRKAGTLGVTGALFQVQGHALNFDECTVDMTLVDASALAGFGHYKVAPDSILDWTAESTANKDKYMFISDATGKYSDATDGHPLA